MSTMHPTDSTTDKPQAHLDTFYSNTHRGVYQEVDREVHQVDQYSTEATDGERNYEVDRMVTEADFKSRSPSQVASTSQCHYRVQDILYRACGGTA